jgi:hypothetical protein
MAEMRPSPSLCHWLQPCKCYLCLPHDTPTFNTDIHLA